MESKVEWHEKDAKKMTLDFIELFKIKYSQGFEEESLKYEKLYFRISIATIIIGVLTSLIAAISINDITSIKIQSFLKYSLVVLPIISTGIFAFSIQFGYKEKFVLREMGRIECVYIYREARKRFFNCKNDAQYLELYEWLNNTTKALQEHQAIGYFNSLKETAK